MKVLITGAEGFIGRAIVAELSGFDFKLFGIGRNKPVCANNQSKVFDKFYSVDITDYKNLSMIENDVKVDTIIHAAGLAHQFKNISRKSFRAAFRVFVNHKIRKLAVINSSFYSIYCR